MRSVVCVVCVRSVSCVVCEQVIHVLTNPCDALCTVRPVLYFLLPIKSLVLYMATVHMLSVNSMYFKLFRANRHVYQPTGVLSIPCVVCIRSIRVLSVCVLSVPVLILFLCWSSHVLSCVLFVQCRFFGTKGLYVVFCALLPLRCLVGCHSHGFTISRQSHWLFVCRPLNVLPSTDK